MWRPLPPIIIIDSCADGVCILVQPFSCQIKHLSSSIGHCRSRGIRQSCCVMLLAPHTVFWACPTMRWLNSHSHELHTASPAQNRICRYSLRILHCSHTVWAAALASRCSSYDIRQQSLKGRSRAGLSCPNQTVTLNAHARSQLRASDERAAPERVQRALLLGVSQAGTQAVSVVLEGQDLAPADQQVAAQARSRDPHHRLHHLACGRGSPAPTAFLWTGRPARRQKRPITADERRRTTGNLSKQGNFPGAPESCMEPEEAEPRRKQNGKNERS